MSEVVLLEYDCRWPIKYENERKFLLSVIGKWNVGGIEHVGSAAVPGLLAKPVIDIMFGVKSLEDSRPTIDILSNSGYLYSDYKGDVMHWFCKPSIRFRTHHLHLIPFDESLWRERIKFRDVLRADSGLANQYAKLKKDLATHYEKDRELYTEKKWPFIQSVLAVDN